VFPDFWSDETQMFSIRIKEEQVLRLNENKDFSYAEAQKDFEFSPLLFEDGIKSELKSIQAQAAVPGGEDTP
jgi:hypothetical protein